MALTSVAMKSFERLALAYLKDTTGPLLNPPALCLQSKQVNMGLHFILQHLDRPGTYVRILFVDFSPAFNTIIPWLLQPKLTQLSMPTSVCQWITSFLTDRQQLLRLGKFSSSTHTIRTGAPHEQHCDCSGVIQIPGTTISQELKWDNHIESIMKKAQKRSAEEVQSATGAAETVLLRHHWIRPLHVNNCLVQLSYQIWPLKTTEGSPNCWANHWYHSPRTLLIQSEQKGWLKSLWTPHIQAHSLFELLPSGRRYRALSTRNSQTQEQFLLSSNPSHEHLTLNVEHTTLLYIVYSPHILIFLFQICTYKTCKHIIVYIIYCVLLFCTLPICILLFYYLCPVLLLSFCCTVELLSL